MFRSRFTLWNMVLGSQIVISGECYGVPRFLSDFQSSRLKKDPAYMGGVEARLRWQYPVAGWGDKAVLSRASDAESDVFVVNARK